MTPETCELGDIALKLGMHNVWCSRRYADVHVQHPIYTKRCQPPRDCHRARGRKDHTVEKTAGRY